MPATSSISKRRRDGGFALYELILALAILGLVAGVIFPRVARAPGPTELRSKAEEIAALFRNDRNAALLQRSSVVSTIDLENREITSGFGGGRVSLPEAIAVRLVQSSREQREGGGGFRFTPDGRSSGGALSLSRGDSTYRIMVNWLTGSVLVSAGAEPVGLPS